jgi:hypothetical protein
MIYNQCGKEAVKAIYQHDGFLMVENPEREGWEREGRG